MVKIAIIGAGFVGATTAYVFAMRQLADEVVLVDVKPGLGQGKGLDIIQSTAVFGLQVRFVGGEEYDAIDGADIIVITAGVQRKPDQKREDTLAINAKIMKDVIIHIKRHAPDSILVIVSNPLDAMTWLAAKESGFDKRRVIGMAGTLDTARYKSFVAEQLGCFPGDVNALVLGGHGDLMVPLSRLATVKGKPVQKLLDEKTLKGIEERTQNGGAEIVNLLGQSAYYAPAAATFEVVEAIIKGSKKPIPVSAWLDGEYDLKELFLGVPCLLGKRGVEKIVELPLDKEERAALHTSAEHIRNLVAELGR